MLVRTPDSVDYGNPRIESNNLRENSELITSFGINVTLPGASELTPRIISTGNNVRYVVGALRAEFNLGMGQKLFAFPSDEFEPLGPNITTPILAVLFDGDTNIYTPIPVSLGNPDLVLLQSITVTTFIRIYLNSIFYISK